ncbi:MAG: polyphenol oxidase family protein [Bdellovibrionia bacterium]
MLTIKCVLIEKVPGVVHGFGTAQEPVPASLKDAWESRRPKHKQVHRCDFVDVKVEGQECGDVDSLFTSRAGLPVGVMTADCVPVLMANKLGTCIAAIHAGWRGTRAHILRKLWVELQARGENPRDWVAAIGPSIGPCCYEVSEELAGDFLEEFKYLDSTGKLAVPSPRRLDLQNINAAELRMIGLKEVDVLRFCTKCSINPLFHSYRREGSGTRQWSIISRTA